MDYRRIIKFGNSSFVVSVPKEWMKKNNLEKGDMVYMNENGNSELVLIPNLPQRERESKEITINIDGKAIKHIKRELISAYLNDFNIIILTGKELEKHSKEIRGITQNLMALEITEQTKDKIVTQDFLNLREVSLNDLIRKMDIIVRSMIADLQFSLEKDNSQTIDQREQDVNRMSYVLLRVVRRGLHDPEYAKSLKFTPIQLFELWNIGSQIELVADEILDVSLTISRDTSPAQKSFLKKALMQIEQSYLSVMKAFYTKDLHLANQVSLLKNEIMDSCKQEARQTGLSLKPSSKQSCDCYFRLLERLIILTKEINKIARRIYS